MSDPRYSDSLSSLALNEGRLNSVAEHALSLVELAKQKDEILSIVNSERPIFVPEFRAFQILGGV